MKFIVAAPKYSDGSGGSIALHYLAHLLAIEGHDSVIAATNTFPESKARLKYWEIGTVHHDFCEGNEMVIYPEVITNNPLNAKHVTRWMLHKEGYHKGVPIDYGDNDLIFQFAPMCTTIERKPDGILRVQWIRTDLFKNNEAPRSLSGFIIRKGAKKKPYSICYRKHPPRSVFLDHEIAQGLRIAAEKFNSLRIVITYDSETWWALCAALCGCLVIIVPTKGISRKEYFDKMPFFRYGIAYGLLDIPRALFTKYKLPILLNEENEKTVSSVRHYINYVANYFEAHKTCVNKI